MRIALNVPALAGTQTGQAELQHVAFACDDALAAARAMHERGAPILPIPANYYDDLAARSELPVLDELRELGVLYDRSEGGELLHFYSALEGRVFFEVLERRGATTATAPRTRPCGWQRNEPPRGGDMQRTQVVEAEPVNGRFTRAASEERELPEAPPLRRLIGPSVILIGVGIASGEYILYPFIASQAGLVFLWAAVVGILMQFFINMEIERYTLATGETAVGGFMRMWKPWGGVLAAGAILATMWPGWATAAATITTFAFGGGDPNTIAIAGLLAIGVALTASPVVYQTVEKLQFLKVGAVVVFLVVALFAVISADAYRGTSEIVTSFGTFPSEIPIAILVGALAASGAGGANNLVQSNWIRDKGFGMGKLRAADRLPHHRPGGGGARQRAPQLPAGRGQPEPLAGLVEAREHRAARVVRADRRDRDHRLLAGRLLDRLQAPRPAGRERLRLHRARGPGARRDRRHVVRDAVPGRRRRQPVRRRAGHRRLRVAPGRRRHPRRLHPRPRA